MSIYDANKQKLNYTQWLIALVSLSCEQADLLPSQIAITDRDAKAFYLDGKSPNEVFFDIWEQDAGNYMAI